MTAQPTDAAIPTPRTDAKWQSLIESPIDLVASCHELRKWAEQLERELVVADRQRAAAEADLDAARAELAEVAAAGRQAQYNAEHAQAELKRVERELDEARKRLRDLLRRVSCALMPHFRDGESWTEFAFTRNEWAAWLRATGRTLDVKATTGGKATVETLVNP